MNRRNTLGRMDPSAVRRQSRRQTEDFSRRNTMAAPRRRSSAFAQRQIKEPRDFKKDKQKNVQRLISFASAYGYPDVLSPQQLRSPSSNLIQSLFLFLFNRLEPNYGDTYDREDVRSFLKRYGYPFNLNASLLQAPGAPTAWPCVLAVLVWLTELVEYIQRRDEDEKANQESLSVERQKSNKMAEQYRQFLLQDADMDIQLEANFNKEYDKIKSETDALKKICAERKAEIDQIRKDFPSLAELRARTEKKAADCTKFRELNASLKARVEEEKERTKEWDKEIEKLDHKLDGSKLELELLKKRKSEQKYSVRDVEQMHHERKMLQNTIDSLDEETKTIRQDFFALQNTLNDHNRSLDLVVEKFNELATQANLIPESAQDAQGGNYTLQLVKQLFSAKGCSGIDKKQLVRNFLSVDLKYLKNHLTSLNSIAAQDTKQLRDEIASLKARVAEFMDEEESLKRKIASILEEVAEADTNYRREKEKCISDLDNDYRELRQAVGPQKLHADLKAQRERELHQIKTDVEKVRKSCDLQIETMKISIIEHIRKCVKQRKWIDEMLDKTLDGWKDVYMHAATSPDDCDGME
eukprot:704185_1